MADFRNRIVGHGSKPASQFQANPLNWRKHPQRQRDAVRASLEQLGWVDVVVENVRTGNLVDGHERVWQALSDDDEVPYVQVDLSEEEERLALAILDPLTNMAQTDAEMYEQLLEGVHTTDAILMDLLENVATAAGLWPDADPFEQMPPISEEEELPYNADGSIKIIVGNREQYAEVFGAITELLAAHPEWKASIA